MRKLSLLLALLIVFAIGHLVGQWNTVRSQRHIAATVAGEVPVPEAARSSPRTQAEPRDSSAPPLVRANWNEGADGDSSQGLDHLTNDEQRDIQVFRDIRPSVVNNTTST